MACSISSGVFVGWYPISRRIRPRSGTRLGLTNASWHDHPILAGLSRPDRIEQPNDDGGQFFLAPVGHGQKLVNRLRAGVTPTAFVRRADQQVVFFFKGDLLALPIDLGGG